MCADFKMMEPQNRLGKVEVLHCLNLKLNKAVQSIYSTLNKGTCGSFVETAELWKVERA